MYCSISSDDRLGKDSIFLHVDIIDDRLEILHERATTHSELFCLAAGQRLNVVVVNIREVNYLEVGISLILVRILRNR